MPKNNNLQPTKLPMALRFGEKSVTEFKNNLSSINVELMSAPTMDELRSYLPQFITATWQEQGDKYYDNNISTKEKDEIIRDALFGKALPTALETINLVFRISGISLQEVTHIIRYRQAAFSADCSGDNGGPIRMRLYQMQLSIHLSTLRDTRSWLKKLSSCTVT